jgi:hypothetical protein
MAGLVICWPSGYPIHAGHQAMHMPSYQVVKWRTGELKGPSVYEQEVHDRHLQ